MSLVKREACGDICSTNRPEEQPKCVFLFNIIECPIRISKIENNITQGTVNTPASHPWFTECCDSWFFRDLIQLGCLRVL